MPYGSFTIGNALRLDLDARDAPCEVEMRVRPNVSIECAMQLARTAATLTRSRRNAVLPTCSSPPIAAMSRPSSSGSAGRFDREHEQRDASDVIGRLSAVLRAEPTYGPGGPVKPKFDVPTPTRA